MLKFETLDERLVPATIHDLAFAGASATLASGAIVQQTDAQPTGTGVIQSFVRVQSAASGGKSEQGYNTEARPLQFDENKSPSFTRSLRAEDVPTVEINGASYREFLLDINQKSSASRLSVDEVRIYFGSQPNLTGYDSTAKTLAGLTASFDLDAGEDSSIVLDGRLNSGSGSGDMLLYVPAAAFATTAPDSYVYLYSKLGVQAGATANGGFEEWAVRKSEAPPPVAGGTASLSGMVFADINGDGAFTGDDYGLGGVPIQLIGVNDLGQTVSLATTTAADGTYSFTGLRAGTYTIIEDALPPIYASNFFDGADTLGTVNGAANGTYSTNDQFSNIQLLDGEHGINYLFAETLGE
jgi:hypothetical protein